MDTELILMQLFSGVALGAILVLTALGLSIIFGMLGVVNFAHGALFMVGAYAGLWVASLTGSFWWGLLVAPIMIGAVRDVDRVSPGAPAVWPLDRRSASAHLRAQLRAGGGRADRVRQ